MKRKAITTIYITELQKESLKKLSEQTKVPVAEYIRQGIDLILKDQGHHLPGQTELFSISKTKNKK